MRRSKCPICGKALSKLERTGGESRVSAHFPFCSERCKLIDLGRWIDGQYSIPEPLPFDDDTDPLSIDT